jgi:dihydroxyacid dehydratase/phosphogluconate dehydratase
MQSRHSLLFSFSGYDGNPCNQHINNLAAKVVEGVWEAGLVGYQFNVIGVSDGLSMGTSGMSFSLPSRDVIADSIETVSLDFGGKNKRRFLISIFPITVTRL